MGFKTYPVAQYAKDHPRRCLCIEHQLGGGALISTFDVETQQPGLPLNCYMRLRDARRALKRLGYTQEGRAWRIIPKKEQPVSTVAAEVIEGEGF